MTHRQARFFFGPLLLAAVVGVFLADDAIGRPLLTEFVVLLLAVLALFEFATITGIPRGVRGALVLSGGLLISTCGKGYAAPGWELVFATVCVLAPFSVLMCTRWRGGVLKRDDLVVLGALALAWLIVVAPAACLSLSLHLPHGLLWTVIVVVGSKLNDIGGYLVGSAIGRHKLCPGISPNKSIEGAIGGLLLGTAGTFAMASQIEPIAGSLAAWQAITFGLVLGVATQLGDLLESMLKRAADVKDSGAVVPAFGGVLDLVDSFIFAAPVGYAVGLAWLG